MNQNKCPICENAKIKSLVQLQEGVFLGKCRICSLVQLIPMPEINEEIEDDYGKSLDIEAYNQYIKELRVPQYEEDLKIIKKLKPKGAIIDIGASFGYFLLTAEKFGYTDLFGIEPSAKIVEETKKRHYHLNLVVGVLGKTRVGKKFDIVTMWSVFEHINEPNRALEDIKAMLKENGLLVIRIPNYKGLASKLVLTFYRLSNRKILQPMINSIYQLDFEYKHFFHYTINTISKLLEKHGFKVITHRLDHGVSPEMIDKRAQLKTGVNFLSSLDSKLVRRITKFLLRFAKLSGRGDDLIVYAKLIV